MNGEPRPKLTSSQIVWIVACVVLITSLFLIGAWLFRPAGEGGGPGGKTGPGAITEQEANVSSFRPEGERPEALTPAQPKEAPLANGSIPTPASLAHMPSQMARPQANAPAAQPLPGPQASKPIQQAPAPFSQEPLTAAKAAVPAAESMAAEKAKADSRAPAAAKESVWYLQVAAVSDKKRAQELQKQLKAKGFPSSQVLAVGNLYKVRIPYKDEGGARAARKKLEGTGVKDAAGAFVVKPER